MSASAPSSSIPNSARPRPGTTATEAKERPAHPRADGGPRAGSPSASSARPPSWPSWPNLRPESRRRQPPGRARRIAHLGVWPPARRHPTVDVGLLPGAHRPARGAVDPVVDGAAPGRAGKSPPSLRPAPLPTPVAIPGSVRVGRGQHVSWCWTMGAEQGARPQAIIRLQRGTSELAQVQISDVRPRFSLGPGAPRHPERTVADRRFSRIQPLRHALPSQTSFSCCLLSLLALGWLDRLRGPPSRTPRFRGAVLPTGEGPASPGMGK